MARTTYLLVDGENIDATLGTSVLGRRPQPEERPRWQRLHGYAADRWEQPVKALFFLAVSGELPISFVQALMAMGYTPVPLQGEGKVVDIALQRTAEALVGREADVLLVSHDGDFAPQMTTLAEAGHEVGVVCFPEFLAGSLRQVPGVSVIDLEHEVGAFTSPLPRLRIIAIEDFDPLDFI